MTTWIICARNDETRTPITQITCDKSRVALWTFHKYGLGGAAAVLPGTPEYLHQYRSGREFIAIEAAA